MSFLRVARRSYMKYFAIDIGLINQYFNNIFYFTPAADYFLF